MGKPEGRNPTSLRRGGQTPVEILSPKPTKVKGHIRPRQDSNP
jgi:hypothetical protein